MYLHLSTNLVLLDIRYLIYYIDNDMENMKLLFCNNSIVQYIYIYLYIYMYIYIDLLKNVWPS